MDSQYAIVELMGRQCFGAKVQEVEQLGIKMLRCEVLTTPPYERDVHPQSLYAITRCTEERAKLACKYLVSAAVMPAERPTAMLGAATETAYDDPESDDIPFGDRLEDPEEDDETALNLEEFECEQCKSQLTEPLDDGMYLPEGWAGVPAGWSLIARGPDDDVYFCSESCVRAFMGKSAATEEPPAESAERTEVPGPYGAIEVKEAIALRCIETIGDWYVLARKDATPALVEYGLPQLGSRLGDGDIQGTLTEMLLLARAIQARQGYIASRCAVRTVGGCVYLWSPRSSARKVVVPLAVADALASEIRSVCAAKSTTEEPGHV